MAATYLAQAPTASAQEAPTVVSGKGDNIDGEIAGIVGLGFIGLDIGLLIPPMIGLEDQGWAYGVFPVLLAGAGAGVGVVTTDGFSKGVNIALIGTGLGLFVPALVGSLAWKSHKQDQELRAQDRGVIRLGSVSLHAPSVAAEPVYSLEERTRWNLAQRNSTRVTLLSGTF